MESFYENGYPFTDSGSEGTAAQAAPPIMQPPHGPRGPIEVVTYNNHWPAIHASESQRLQTAFQNAGIAQRIVAVEHIGSTSVPGLHAKPIVDLMVGVRTQADLSAFPADVLLKLGYVHRSFSKTPHAIANPPRLLFSKYAAPATNVHIFVYGSSRWQGHLGLRNYLRAHPQSARHYASIKHVFAARYGNDIAAYARAKRPFLDALERKALGQQSHATQTRQAAVPATTSVSHIPPSPLPPPSDPPGKGGGNNGSGNNGGSANPPQTIDYTDPWPVNVWYIQQTNAPFVLSPNQNPTSGATPDIYWEWTGTEFYIYGVGTDGSPDAGIADAGQLNPANVPYIQTMNNEDGSTYTIAFYPTDVTPSSIPSNAIPIDVDNGVMWYYNDDGSPWDFQTYPIGGNNSDPSTPPDWLPTPDGGVDSGEFSDGGGFSDDGGFYENGYPQ